MKKIVRLGTAKTYRGRAYSIFCKIEFKDGRLSISGVEGPLPSGNCLGACGQIDMHLRDQQDTITPAPGWDRDKLAHFFAIWNRWHLNDMRAGSPAQMAELAKHTYPGQPTSHYDWAKQTLAAAGLEPDNGYSYGSAWLTEEVPDSVIEWLTGLPDTDVQPAWV